MYSLLAVAVDPVAAETPVIMAEVAAAVVLYIVLTFL